MTSLPDSESQIRIRVPREEVVASNRPDGGRERVVKAVLWAMIMETGCLDGGGGGFDGIEDPGGPLGFGKGQGGR